MNYTDSRTAAIAAIREINGTSGLHGKREQTDRILGTILDGMWNHTHEGNLGHSGHHLAMAIRIYTGQDEVDLHNLHETVMAVEAIRDAYREAARQEREARKQAILAKAKERMSTGLLDVEAGIDLNWHPDGAGKDYEASVEASMLGLKPGEWPEEMWVTGADGSAARLFKRAAHDPSQMVHYGNEFHTLTVWND